MAEPGPPLTEAQLGERDHFLTGRWRAFSTIAGRLAHVPVEHQPWPLRSVRMLQVDEKPAHRRRSPTAGRGAVGALLAGCRRALRPSSVLTVDDPTDQGATKGLRWRFDGEIAAFGTATGHRVVVGRWPVSPFGPVADIMLEVPDATRLLIASSDELADFVASIYSFDAVAVEPVEVIRRPGLLSVATRQLRANLTVGRRTGLGLLLRAVPPGVATTAAWARLVNPLAGALLPGVRTHGSAGAGRSEWYGARDLHLLESVTALWRGRNLGAMADVHPPVRFGFGSAPRRPAVVRVTTTVQA